MCSIIGCFSKNNDVVATIIKGLKRMEYRGYDSVGIATFSDSIQIEKDVGRVVEVEHKFDKLKGHVGIGHTRWATHGEVSAINAHPHLDEHNRVAIVHNGIIENYLELKEKFHFVHKSETDSEVIANLLAMFYAVHKNPQIATVETLKLLQGNFAFVALFDNGVLTAARNHEPIVIGITPIGYTIASDVLGFIEMTDKAIYLNDRQFVTISRYGLACFDFDGNRVGYETTQLSKEIADVYKHDFAHFTLKEIFEQPETVKKIIVEDVSLFNNKNIYLTGSGTSYNACLIGKYLLNKYAKIKAETIISSESQFLNLNFDDNCLLLALSQSGESADVLETVMKAKNCNSKIIALVNRTTSTLASISDLTIGINCGPEIGVAATKSFTSQVATLAKITEMLSNEVLFSLEDISEKMKIVLSNVELYKTLADSIKYLNDIYILGRGIHHTVALEASLKIKELAYMHAEGIAGGELKHGPLALMDKNTFVVLLNPEDATHNDMLISASQIKSRGAKVVGISNKNNQLYDYWIEIPECDNDLVYAIIEMVPIQLLSYYLALAKDNNPDYPRNLAKSVTVK